MGLVGEGGIAEIGRDGEGPLGKVGRSPMIAARAEVLGYARQNQTFTSAVSRRGHEVFGAAQMADGGPDLSKWDEGAMQRKSQIDLRCGDCRTLHDIRECRERALQQCHRIAHRPTL